MLGKFLDASLRRKLQLPNYFQSVAETNFATHWKHSDTGTDEFRGLQVGAYSGDASSWMLLGTSVLKRKIYLTDIDTWLGSEQGGQMNFDWNSIEEFYDHRLAKYVKTGRLTKQKQSSDEFFESNSKNFDFIYVDGSHEKTQVSKDAENSFAILKSKGILAFDDYLWGSELEASTGPRAAIDDFIEAHHDELTILEKGYQVWIRKH